MTDYLFAFLVGGAFCALGELLILKTKLSPARILVGFVLLGVVAEALGLYQGLVDFAKSGARVPLTGFGYLLARGVREAVDETGLLGALTGGLTTASAGISAVIVFGFLSGLIFHAKPDRTRKYHKNSIYKNKN